MAKSKSILFKCEVNCILSLIKHTSPIRHQDRHPLPSNTSSRGVPASHVKVGVLTYEVRGREGRGRAVRGREETLWVNRKGKLIFGFTQFFHAQTRLAQN